MKGWTVGLAALVLLVGVGQAEAVILTPSGAGTLDGTFDGLISFAGNGTLLGTVVEKTLTGFADMVLTVDYSAADIDFSFADSASTTRQGLRWGELITNGTGVPWSAYSIELGGTNGHEFVVDTGFSGGFVPDYADITGMPTGPVSVDLVDGTISTSGGEVTISGVQGALLVSADKRQLTFSFATPLDPSESFGVWISPLVTSAAEGHLELTQSASAIPEPTSMIIWLLLGVVGITVGCWRQRGNAG